MAHREKPQTKEGVVVVGWPLYVTCGATTTDNASG